MKENTRKNRYTVQKFVKWYKDYGSTENNSWTDRQLLRVVKENRRNILNDKTALINERTPTKISEEGVKRRVNFIATKEGSSKNTQSFQR